MPIIKSLSLSSIFKLLCYMTLGMTSASAFSISLYCTPESLGGWNTAMQNKGQFFPETCRDYRMLYPKNLGCSSFDFNYEVSSEFARMNQSTYELISKTDYEYEFQRMGVTGFESNGELYSSSSENKIKIDRRSLQYTYTHGISLKIAPNAFNSNLMIEGGTCIVIESIKEKPIF